MFAIAGRLRRIGMSEGSIVAALLVTNRERCQPPLSDDEVRKIATSIAKYAPHYDAAHGSVSIWEAACPA
jgi:homoserine kinase